MNNKLKISALGLAVSFGIAGWTYAQTTPDGQSATIHQAPATEPVPNFMQSINAGGEGSPAIAPASEMGNAAPVTAQSQAVDPSVIAQPPQPSEVNPTLGPVAVDMPRAPMNSVSPPLPTITPSVSPGRLSSEEAGFFQEQADLQRQTQLMEARVKLIEQQAKYEETMRKMVVSAPMPQSPQPNVFEKPAVASSYDAHLATDEKALSEMTLVSVYGEGKNLAGELFYRGGRMTVKKGDTLPGDWRVASIEPSRLMAVKGKRRFEIGLGSPQSSAGAAAQVPFDSNMH